MNCRKHSQVLVLLVLACSSEATQQRGLPAPPERPAAPRGPVTNREDALANARSWLRDHFGDAVIQEDQTTEHNFGWVVRSLPRRYAETRDPGDMRPGWAPIAVFRQGGTCGFSSSR